MNGDIVATISHSKSFKESKFCFSSSSSSVFKRCEFLRRDPFIDNFDPLYDKLDISDVNMFIVLRLEF